MTAARATALFDQVAPVFDEVLPFFTGFGRQHWHGSLRGSAPVSSTWAPGAVP
jgi:hypothetical protein